MITKYQMLIKIVKLLFRLKKLQNMIMNKDMCHP